jgi:gluconolactonase
MMGTGSGGAAAADAGAPPPDAGFQPAPNPGNVRVAGRKSSCPAGPFPKPMVLSTKDVCADFAFNYNFNEGPTWVASRNAFFFSNYIVRSPAGGDMIKYTPGGTCEVFIPGVGCNGLAATGDGNVLAACHQSRSVVHFDLSTKQGTTIADQYMGMMLDSVNDLVIHSNGSVYFTNTTYELGTRPIGAGLGVFRIDPLGSISLVAQTPCNGIALSPDERKLYVLMAGVWDLDAQGVPSGQNAQPALGGDGMAVDCAGNLYMSGTIYDPQGQVMGSYASPGGTNLAFGGPDGKTLLVAGMGLAVREIQMNVPGFP